MVTKLSPSVLVLGAYQFPKWWSIYTASKRPKEKGFEVVFLSIADLNTPSWETAFSIFVKLRTKETPLLFELKKSA